VASPAFFGNVIAAAFTVPFLRIKRGPLRPSWSMGFEIVARALKSRAATIARLDWAEQRKAWASMESPAPILKEVKREKLEHAGMQAEWFSPAAGPSSSSVVLYLHGGSFIYGSIETHREMIARIALATGGRVLAIDYRLAPEHPFPAALDDALAAYRALRERGLSASRIVLGGDSAGANMALSTAISLRDAGDPPAGVIAMSPWIDLTARGGSLESNAPYDYAEPKNFQAWADAYLKGGGSARDPRVSPLFADLAKLPPTLVLLGGAEMLHDQVIAFVTRAQAAGSPVELYEQADMIHNFPVFAGTFPECAPAFDRIGEFVTAHAK
jgi:monoterpene epsilon-lactone hydrolase